MRFIALQCNAASAVVVWVCCSAWQCVAVFYSVVQRGAVCCCVLYCVPVCCCVLQYVVVCCSVMQCVAACVQLQVLPLTACAQL